MDAFQSAVNAVVKRCWGFDEAKPFQLEAIRAVRSRRDVLIVQATGSGKSLCYQLPPLLAPHAMSVVISPLISLMQDQVSAAKMRGIRADFIGANADDIAIFEEAASGHLDVLFLTPEKLANEACVARLRALHAKGGIGLLAVDEAHCVSEWGCDFRPDYRKIADRMRSALPGLPLMALTATATERVRADMVANLQMRSPLVLLSTFNRPNLFYAVHPKRTPLEDLRPLVEALRASPTMSCLVYVLKQKDCESIAELLRNQGIQAEPYHAGMSVKNREQVHRNFSQDRVQVVCATVAFGMGIDKPDVRRVIHYGLPKSLETYYQQSGRAGRDGGRAECHLFFSAADSALLNFYLQDIALEHHDAVRLMFRSMQAYADEAGCRRRFLLRYFGETAEAECGLCDNCADPGSRAEQDYTDDAKILLLAVSETGERFGMTLPVSVVRGARNQDVTSKERLFRMPLDKMKSYGSGRHRPDDYWKALFRALSRAEYLAGSSAVSQGGMSFETFSLSAKGRAALFDKADRERIVLPVPAELSAPHARRARPSGGDAGAGPSTPADPRTQELYAKLVEWRKGAAHAAGVPAYCICENRTLEAICALRPSSCESLRTVAGMGERRVHDYGQPIVDFVRRFCEPLGLAMDVGCARASSSGGGGSASKPLSATKLEALALHQAGKSVAEIAALKSIKEETIQNYLADCLAAGEDVDLARLGVTPELLERVRAARERVAAEGGDVGKLKPIKEKLPETVTWGQLKIALGKLDATGAPRPALAVLQPNVQPKASIVGGGGAADPRGSWRDVVRARGKRPSDGGPSPPEKRPRTPPSAKEVLERLEAAGGSGGLTEAELDAAFETPLKGVIEQMQLDGLVYQAASGRFLLL